jgi:flagellar basal-body rod protein FlgB
MMMNGPIDPFVEKMLDVTMRRQEAISSNLANLDTPGYKAKDVVFQQELASSSNQLALASTHSGHITLSSGSSTANSPVQLVDSDAPEKPNGNNVDLDHQMMEMNKNGMQYVMLIQNLGSTIKTLRAAITDGGRG